MENIDNNLHDKSEDEMYVCEMYEQKIKYLFYFIGIAFNMYWWWVEK